LGMAIANRSFAKRLSDEVGFRAFTGPSEGGFCSVEHMLAGELNKKVFCDEIGITQTEGEKLSDTILRILRKEAEQAFLIKNAAHDQKTILELSDSIAKDTASL